MADGGVWVCPAACAAGRARAGRWCAGRWRFGLHAAWALPLAGRPAGPERRVAAGVGFEPAGNTASDRAARHRARVQSRGMKTGSAAKAGRPMFSGEMKKTFEKAAGREEAAFGMA